MEKAKIIIKKASGEVKECKINKNKPAFLYFKTIDEYRFNTVIECLEKKINGKWIEWHTWETIELAEILSKNPIWTDQRKKLFNEILFLMDEKKMQLLESLANILITTQEMKKYKEFVEKLNH